VQTLSDLPQVFLFVLLLSFFSIEVIILVGFLVIFFSFNFFFLTLNKHLYFLNLSFFKKKIISSGGRMSFRFEETIHRFQNMVADHMIGLPRIPAGDEISIGGYHSWEAQIKAEESGSKLDV
jgi:hypothetical protein